MADQVKLPAEAREERGKGASGRLRRDGRVPAIVYGYEVDATAVHVDTRELYHALHTEAGANVLIRLQVDGDEHLCVARDVQRHPVRGDMLHVDFIAVDPTQKINVEIPVQLTDEEGVDAAGVLSHVLYTVPIRVSPLEVPNRFELSVDGMEIGDVRRVEDLADQLPADAEFDIELDRTVVTINAPDILEEPEEEEEELLEGELPEGELPEGEEAPEDASEVPAEGEGPTTDSDES
ncbi:MAG: 50S ribosomal protein L25 [Nitriliruptorales bacterium]|nr:50S ribosomal protein L25 [Nitriliruptorales bacterium]